MSVKNNTLSPVIETVGDESEITNIDELVFNPRSKVKQFTETMSSRIPDPMLSSDEESEDDDENDAYDNNIMNLSDDSNDYYVYGKADLDYSSGDNSFDTTNFRGRPSSCVFVASLAAAMSDDHLCISVTKHFKKWGKLAMVKVLRDPSNRPYAFVQYTNDEDAKRALKGAQHSILDGRAIRCEPARVNRTLYVATTSDAALKEVDIRKNLEIFGEIEQLVGIGSLDKTMFSATKRNGYNNYNNNNNSNNNNNNNINNNNNPNSGHRAWFCKFVYRDDAIRAYADLRVKPFWIVEWAQNLDAVDKPSGDEIAEVTIDKFSIFVGQLSAKVTKEKLLQRFKRHGKIAESNLISRQQNTFAFIKYETEVAAAAAVERENHAMLLDKTMHVQYREMHHHVKKRSQASKAPSLLNLAPPPVNLPVRRASTGSILKPSAAPSVPQISTIPLRNQMGNFGFQDQAVSGPNNNSKTYSFNNYNNSNNKAMSASHNCGNQSSSTFSEKYASTNFNDDESLHGICSNQFISEPTAYSFRSSNFSSMRESDQLRTPTEMRTANGTISEPKSPTPSPTVRTANSTSVAKTLYSPTTVSGEHAEEGKNESESTNNLTRQTTINANNNFMPNAASVPYYYYLPSSQVDMYGNYADVTKLPPNSYYYYNPPNYQYYYADATIPGAADTYSPYNFMYYSTAIANPPKVNHGVNKPPSKSKNRV
ncbi:hypothetical protein PACTADRAFT_32211 [Pachysolen tannophilus NRRL Y-2460]|uniref:RRM domain-containing protein n=1 Tax=Pachysolen tannophilus NRRL Y-2460 TaxID=669874 RepID=A0A1E4TYA9_PACTA|nr:hypothetical protein PACTADRAFT_32211 [Pachysolen tannophilus NRRL Y-2460]